MNIKNDQTFLSSKTFDIKLFTNSHQTRLSHILMNFVNPEFPVYQKCLEKKNSLRTSKGPGNKKKKNPRNIILDPFAIWEFSLAFPCEFKVPRAFKKWWKKLSESWALQIILFLTRLHMPKVKESKRAKRYAITKYPIGIRNTTGPL